MNLDPTPDTQAACEAQFEVIAALVGEIQDNLYKMEQTESAVTVN